MASSHRTYSDLFEISNVVKQTAITHSKNILIDVLRDHFKQDTMYRYVQDPYGFPLTPDLTDSDPYIDNTCTTRIYIGDIFRYDKRFWPAIVIRHSSGRYFPISFNQNQTTRYRMDLVLDGYDRSFVRVPTHQVFAGGWDQTFELQIASESTIDREELTDIVSLFLIATSRQALHDGGLFIKNVSMGAEREEQWGNDYVYLQSINVETFSEWRIEVPINNLIEGINFCFNFQLFGSDSFSTSTAVLRQEDNTIALDVEDLF